MGTREKYDAFITQTVRDALLQRLLQGRAREVEGLPALLTEFGLTFASEQFAVLGFRLCGANRVKEVWTPPPEPDIHGLAAGFLRDAPGWDAWELFQDDVFFAVLCRNGTDGVSPQGLGQGLVEKIAPMHSVAVAVSQEKTGMGGLNDGYYEVLEVLGIIDMQNLRNTALSYTQLDAATYQVDGQVKFSLLEDGFLDYVTLLNQWYSEGLISRDFVSCDADTNGPGLAGYVTSGQTGIWFGDVSQMQSYDDSATDAGFHCVAITDPVQKEGDVTHFDSDRTGLTSYSVAATCENPEIVMSWVNYWFTDEGILLANYGIEGESYTMDESGKPQYTELMTANPDGDTFKTCQLLYTMVMVPTVVDTSASFGLYSDAQLEAQQIWSSNIDDAYVLPEITMTEDENNELSAIYSDLSTMISEKLIRFIIGDEPLENWPGFVEEMRAMNADRCVEIYQAALDRYLNR